MTIVDGRLMERLSAAGESDLVEAILVVKESPFISLDDAGLLQRLIDAAIEYTDDLPTAVRYFPRANAVVLSASPGFIQEILKDENLAVASAAEVGSIPFFI